MDVNIQNAIVTYPHDIMNNHPLQLMRNGLLQAVLNIDHSDAMVVSFDSIRINIPGQQIDFNLVSNVDIDIHVTSIVVFNRVSNAVITVTYAQPGQIEERAKFST